MSATVQLQARPRVETGKEVARKLRAEGRIPAVVYGKDMEARGISLDRRETELLFHRISVDNTIVELVIEGEKGAVQTLVREVQTTPDRPEVLHVDFLRIQKGVLVELDIPVHLVGTPTGVRDGGGILEQLIHEIPVKCLPSNIPEEVRVEVVKLGLGEALHVSDIDLGEDVEILLDDDRTICMVAAPRVVAAAGEGAEGEGAGEPEVIGGEGSSRERD